MFLPTFLYCHEHFLQKAPSQMFEGVLNTPMIPILIRNNFISFKFIFTKNISFIVRNST